ncbi:hypothetical protein H257_03219 [Aphanomyces astaci]|uniref:Uncharacterized protein n=1 Tax=Aphanomyces astaci TaxID=112090 RepID=W4H1N5_APHAT|nr:hypothetical protein H257_03219 [Aphanomyces astaci]ETV85496.1 hypothetical protein H257_03219 [Aphanomyces astaci]|eukprot:XP_009825514.1 hypothetical protein H257_03219 [Aphanomyces astaci]
MASKMANVDASNTTSRLSSKAVVDGGCCHADEYGTHVAENEGGDGISLPGTAFEGVDDGRQDDLHRGSSCADGKQVGPDRVGAEVDADGSGSASWNVRGRGGSMDSSNTQLK